MSDGATTHVRQAIVWGLKERLGSGQAPRLLEVIKPPGGGKEKVSPFTVVRLDADAAGLAWNLLEDEEQRRSYDLLDADAFSGSLAMEVAGELLHPQMARRIVGYAVCNALSQLLLRQGSLPVKSGNNILDMLDPDPEDHVGVVGYAPPMVRDISRCVGQVSVLERGTAAPAKGNIRIAATAQELGACNKVLITSTTLLNDTFEEVVEATTAARFRVLYGPGAAILPEVLFARGIDALAGTLVTDPGALADRQRRGKRWGDAKRKIVVSRG